MDFLSPNSIPKSLAPTNDQNFGKDRHVFLFKLVFEIRFSDAVLATEVIFVLFYQLFEVLVYPYEGNWECG